MMISQFASEQQMKQRNKWHIDFAPDVRNLIDAIPSSSIYANCVCDTDFQRTWIDDNTASIVIIGDAAHSMTPSLGQGANVGLEDAAELGHLLRKALADDDYTSNNIVETINQHMSRKSKRDS